MLILLTKSVKNGIVCLSSTVILINVVLFESFEETRPIQLQCTTPFAIKKSCVFSKTLSLLSYTT